MVSVVVPDKNKLEFAIRLFRKKTQKEGIVREARRRKEFEKRLEKCNNVPTEMKNACYSNLRAIENSKSQVYSQDRRDRVLRVLLLNSRF